MKGKKTGGRRPGSANKLPAAVKEMITEALQLEGGVNYLRGQARLNPTAFMTLVGKVLPLQVAGPSGDVARPRRVIIELQDGGADDAS
jgi:hypothetical protein